MIYETCDLRFIATNRTLLIPLYIHGEEFKSQTIEDEQFAGEKASHSC